LSENAVSFCLDPLSVQLNAVVIFNVQRCASTGCILLVISEYYTLE